MGFHRNSYKCVRKTKVKQGIKLVIEEMKSLRYYYIAIAILVCAGCKQKEEDPAAAPKRVLQEALQSLHDHNYDAYMQVADVDCELDSVHASMLRQLLQQHQEMNEARNGAVLDVSVIDAKMISDTICTVYCQTTYADSTREVSSHKMVVVDGQWKIRLRN